jgi:hypothetical protein
VRIGADHHAAGEGVLLEHHLVDDARAGSPEADAVARRGGAQELVHFAVGLACDPQVVPGPGEGLDQVVAVHGGGHGGLVAAREHELEQGHLRRRVLHGDAIRAGLQVAAPGLEVGVLGVGQVAEEDLLRVGERAAEAPPQRRDVALEALVRRAHELEGGLDRGHGSSSRARAVSREASPLKLRAPSALA